MSALKDGTWTGRSALVIGKWTGPPRAGRDGPKNYMDLGPKGPALADGSWTGRLALAIGKWTAP